jgi:CRT-like, chloroquine-resistance transporter-like
LFLSANLLFNVIAITALRSVGAATMAIVMTAAVPATVFAFTLDLPVLGPGQPLTSSQVPGLLVVLAGMLLYNAKALFQIASTGAATQAQ